MFVCVSQRKFCHKRPGKCCLLFCQRPSSLQNRMMCPGTPSQMIYNNILKVCGATERPRFRQRSLPCRRGKKGLENHLNGVCYSRKLSAQSCMSLGLEILKQHHSLRITLGPRLCLFRLLHQMVTAAGSLLTRNTEEPGNSPKVIATCW